ncbi:hypothetical protein ABNF97_08810 [Plantactinospora sp. B6F1]|uniref:hypothetical protein n=1 Tax=Plantactinospora sp. B6F1 TaxID=3158971 RepID=UPI0032D901BF
MLSVALVRPVWWIACRSLRFVTALVLMGLLLGAPGARSGLTDPAFAATGSSSVGQSPSVGHSTVEDERPSTSVEGAAATDERPVPTGSVPTVLVRAGLLGREPVRPALGSAAGVWPAGDAYARVVGPRAPPLG